MSAIRATVFAALAGLTLAAPANAFQALNGLSVERQGALIHVPYSGQSGARAFWCAAADFAERGLHLPLSTRLYRTTAVPRAPGQGVDFSLDPSQAVGKGPLGTGLLGIGSSDGGRTVAHAKQFCNDRQHR